MSADVVDYSYLSWKAFLYISVYIGAEGCYRQALSGSARFFYLNLTIFIEFPK